jgi:hypothetical protein
MAHSGHRVMPESCPLSEVWRTSRHVGVMSAFDPKRTRRGASALTTGLDRYRLGLLSYLFPLISKFVESAITHVVKDSTRKDFGIFYRLPRVQSVVF